MTSKINKKLAAAIMSLLLLCTVSLTACTNKKTPEKVSKSRYLLNTVVTVTLYDGSDESIIDDCMDLCLQYENMLSRTVEGSEIAMVNSRENMTVSDETAELIRTGLYYAELSGGAFDITAGSITSLWDFTGDRPFAPDAAALAEAVKHVGYEKVSMEGNTVIISDDELIIDLGAIAKGYIADKMKEYLLSRGVESAIIDLGGNILLVGGKPGAEDGMFTVGIQYPFQDMNTVIATIKLNDMTVVSSGVYERFFIEDGKIYHHILNTETGYPVDNGLLSVSIICHKSTDGDALSTTVFALGLEDGMALIDSLEDTYAIFIDNDFNVYYSAGLEDAFDIEKQQ